MSCRKLLLKLTVSGVLDLPKQEKVYVFEHRVKSIEPDIPELCCNLGELGTANVFPVESRYSNESKIWFGILPLTYCLLPSPEQPRIGKTVTMFALSLLKHLTPDL
jgi:hypothetical protein